MGSLFSGVGLVSGINSQQIVDQLISIDGRPRDILQNRIGALNNRRTAFLDISARLTAMLTRVLSLSKPATFRTISASSSAPDVLGAAATDGARAGSYTFTVRSLASTQQLLSRSFAETSSSLAAGTISIETAAARVNAATTLDELNGYRGVQRGEIEIQDRSGKSTIISLTQAATLNDVVDAVNRSGASAQASIIDGKLVLKDTSGGSGTLRINEVNSGRTAADLGFGEGNNAADGATLQGSQLLYLSGLTPLSSLNDDLGLRRSSGSGDFSIQAANGSEFRVDLSNILKSDTRLERLNHGSGVNLGVVRLSRRDGKSAEVDLRGAVTIDDIKKRLDGAFDDKKTSVILNGNRLVISDSSEVVGSRSFRIEDVSGTAARDLGIANSSDSGKIEGRSILSVDTLADALAAINSAAGNMGDNGPLVRAEIAAFGRGLQLIDQSGGEAQLTLKNIDGGNPNALNDLGFQPGAYGGGGSTLSGKQILAGPNTVLLKSLNGGRGVDAGTVRISLDGHDLDVDLAGATTLEDVTSRINTAATNANLAVKLEVDSTGTRLVAARTDRGSGEIQIRDQSGDLAKTFGLDAAGGTKIRGANLERRYISENTLLSSLNSGRGVSAGKFKITNRDGTSFQIETRGETTLGDIIGLVNEKKTGVTARINDTGDGLLLEDTTSGKGAFRVEEDGGTTARDLNLLGESNTSTLDGSFEMKLEITANDTLQSLTDRINAKSRFATAALVNDGSQSSPWRMTLSARASGTANELIIDGGSTTVDFSTLVQARDARLLIGNDPRTGLTVTSSTNTFSDVVKGLSLSVSSVSDTPVSVTVAESTDAALEAVKGLVSDFNDAVAKIRDSRSYDQKTERAGALLGDSTLQIVEDRIFRLFLRGAGKTGGISRPSEIGFSFGDGGKLSLDETKFKKALDSKPEDLTRFFTDSTTGLATVLKKEIEGITKDKGIIPQRTQTLSDQADQLTSRIAQMNTQLESKRTRLLRQFQQMESALASIQSQQSSLSSMAGISFSSK